LAKKFCTAAIFFLLKVMKACFETQHYFRTGIMTQPYRSALYVPASNARALDKAASLPVDALILDLEDAVAVAQKDAARDVLAEALDSNDYGPRARLVRINGLATPWGRNDLAAFGQRIGVDGLVVPKVTDPADLDAVAALAPEIPLWAMMETPLAMLNAGTIAAHPRLVGMVMGTNDLAKDLGSRARADRLPMLAGLGLCVLAARAHGRVILDGVYNALHDTDGLVAECQQGRDMGFDGKSLIHPAQVDIANAAFAPTEAELDLARRQIAAYDAAIGMGTGIAVLDDRIVENLHVAAARSLIARAEAIAARAI
jgi:(3S)-malyl-CoA thioesterase